MISKESTCGRDDSRPASRASLDVDVKALRAYVEKKAPDTVTLVIGLGFVDQVLGRDAGLLGAASEVDVTLNREWLTEVATNLSEWLTGVGEHVEGTGVGRGTEARGKD